MKLSRSILADSALSALGDQDREQRELALEYIAEAWQTAEDDGVEVLALAHASLFAAIAEMVAVHGEFATSSLIAQLPERIRSGDYSLTRSLQ